MNYELRSCLISPMDGTPLSNWQDEICVFEGMDEYPIFEGIPILVAEEKSLFAIEDILRQKPQTQDIRYSDKRVLKNYVRTAILPKLNRDFNLRQRYKNLAKDVHGGKILVVGAGDKVDFYRSIFSGCEVITSDVHLQFRPDIVFDIHNVPFKDNCFDLVIAAQVFEHTCRPWIAASELERVCVPGGLIQIEVPFAFPYHGAPYDFFRFTFTGLRMLFSSCTVKDFGAPEGNFTALAVTSAQALVDLSSNRLARYSMLVISRLLFFGLKYLDRYKDVKTLRAFTMPKGYHVTFQKDGRVRSEKECLRDFDLLRQSRQ